MYIVPQWSNFPFSSPFQFQSTMSPVPRNLTLRLEFQTSSGRAYELDNPMNLGGGWGKGEGGVRNEMGWGVRWGGE